MKKHAVFLDRDDTLMVNVPYLGDPGQVEIFPDAAEALYALRKADFLLFIVSNQSGVGRGLISREQVHAVNTELKRQMNGDYIHAFYHSFATPDDPYATDRSLLRKSCSGPPRPTTSTWRAHSSSATGFPTSSAA